MGGWWDDGESGVGRRRGKDSNQAITPREPESESDKSEMIQQTTRPKRNRRPKQTFTYDILGKPSYQRTQIPC